jgi:hypothetical protein
MIHGLEHEAYSENFLYQDFVFYLIEELFQQD